MARWPIYENNLDAPAQSAWSVSPNDETDFEQDARALYIGSAGDVTLQTTDGSEVTFANVPAGSILPVQVRRVLANGTDAEDIIALR